MDDLAWDRCPDCLGLLDAVAVAGGAALACVLCGYIGAVVEVPATALPSEVAVLHLPGF